MTETVSTFEPEFEGESGMWRVEDCIELGCPSLSVIENDGIVEYCCSLQGKVADELRFYLTSVLCSDHRR